MPIVFLDQPRLLFDALPRVSRFVLGQRTQAIVSAQTRLCEGGMRFTFVTKMRVVDATRVLVVLLLALTCCRQNLVSGLRSLGASPTSGCWDLKCFFEQDCYHAEPLTVQPYPLTEEMLGRSVPYPTSDALLHRAFQNARRSGTLHVAVLGGSVTFGHGCESPMELRLNDCAWPHRLEQWFQQRIHDFDVEVRIDWRCTKQMAE